MTIKAQKHKLLRDDSSDFLIILLNKINTDVWNTVQKSNGDFLKGLFQKSSFISEDERCNPSISKWIRGS